MRFNIFSLLSKKGVLIIGILIGVLAVLFSSSFLVRAEEKVDSKDDSGSDQDLPKVIFSGTLNEGGSWNIDTLHTWTFLGGEDPIKIMCAIKGSTTEQNNKSVTDYEILCNNSGLVGLSHGTYPFSHYYKIWNADGYRTDDVDCQGSITINDVISGSFSIYVFDSKEKAIGYLQGTVDAADSLNYDDIQKQNREFAYYGDCPYYDNASFAVNADKSVTYQLSMSEAMQQTYQDILDESGGGFYMDYRVYAVYARSVDLGFFNSYVIDNGDWSNLVNNKKIDDLINFDENGRLIVGNTDDIYSSHSGGGGRHGNGISNPFSFLETSPLYARAVDNVYFEDQVKAEYSFSKMFDETYSIQLTPAEVSAANAGGYTLIGYYADSGITYSEDGVHYEYGKSVYTYTWLSAALRDRYGSKSYFSDAEGNADLDNAYEFDKGGNWTSSSTGSLDTDGVLNHVNDGYGLLGRDGYLELSRRFFLGVPDYIWALIAMAMSVSIVVILFKALRGM